MDTILHKVITVLSFGGGQDSTAILYRLVHDKAFRAQYAPGRLLVIMADTGDEHDQTNSHVKEISGFCSQHNIQFVHITNDMGFHIESWPDLMTPQTRKDGGKFRASYAIMSQKTCTSNLKLVPIYKFLDDWINKQYHLGFHNRPGGGCGKQAIKKFVQDGGSIRVLIGFAAGEEKRVNKANSLMKAQMKGKADIFWKYIKREFPLIGLGMDRKGCQDYIKSLGYKVPMPSNCMRCPYMSMEELLWLSINHPEKYQEWVQIERKKLARDKREGAEKSCGIFGGAKTIPERLAKVKAKYAHLSEQELNDFLNNWKMNHGCGSSAY